VLLGEQLLRRAEDIKPADAAQEMPRRSVHPGGVRHSPAPSAGSAGPRSIRWLKS
jgi:hypothetical protein